MNKVLEVRGLTTHFHMHGYTVRAMIAIAMACEPDIMIADEPATALDVTIQAQILRLMGSPKERTGSSIMFITHDLAVIASFSNRVMVMYAGVVVEQSAVRDVYRKPLHPYTVGLLGSIPVLGEVKRNPDGSGACSTRFRARCRIIAIFRAGAGLHRGARW